MFTKQYILIDNFTAALDNPDMTQSRCHEREITMVRQFTALVLLLSLVSCNPKDDSTVSLQSKYPVDVSMGSYTTAGFSQFLIPSAYAAVSDLRFCFKRLRFKKNITDIDDPLVDENIDLSLGEVSISAAGTTLSVVNIPADTYYRVEFDLEPTCGGNSLYLSNDFGVYSSTESIKIKFDGVFVVDGSETLQLGVQDILNAANSYNGATNLKEHMQATSGNF